MDYVAFIHSDAAAHGISFPDFPGCISVGTTKEDAIRHGAEALAFHIEGLVEDGLPIPRPMSVSDIKADPDLADWRQGATLTFVPSVAHFVASLAATPGGCLFNPWFDWDRHNDAGREAPTARRRHLTHYLATRIGRAKYLLIAEAPGYAGAHFSGIAMTSERMLLGHRTDVVCPEDVLPALEPTRTSSSQTPIDTVRREGHTERTATIVWKFLLQDLLWHPLDFVLWNAVPWHPYNANTEMLSNRRPDKSEQDASRGHLLRFLALYPHARRIAVGGISERMLRDCGNVVGSARHPANGGATKFKNDMREIARQRSTSDRRPMVGTDTRT